MNESDRWAVAIGIARITINLEQLAGNVVELQSVPDIIAQFIDVTDGGANGTAVPPDASTFTVTSAGVSLSADEYVSQTASAVFQQQFTIDVAGRTWQVGLGMCRDRDLGTHWQQGSETGTPQEFGRAHTCTRTANLT